jgi:TolB protein
MDNNKIEALERRYQTLLSDYQADKIDEATFIAEVDQLQFQDEWGRYWMVGAQSGAWHYYDGQTWHQAEPHDAESLPFMDEQGRYWQRGVRSGDWYYYNPETKEWVKPDPQGDSRPVPVIGRGEPKTRRPSSASYPTQSYQPSAGVGSTAPQFDGELFQDDDGRYWAIGAKTGQWYFYDETGWHPAHEFQPGGASPYSPTQPYQPTPGYPGQSYYSQQPPQTFYQPPQDPWTTPGYASSPYPQPPQTGPGYAYPPQQPIYQQQPTSMPPQQPQPAMPQTEAPTTPVSTEPSTAKTPPPPGGESESGSWYYFDGKQWLKYSSGEPVETSPTSPKMVIDQEIKPVQGAKAAKPKTEVKSEPVMAEFVEEDEPPVEVVDVEVITVIEPEPEAEPELKGRTPSTPLAQAEEIEPRHGRRPSDTLRSQPASAEPQKQPRDRIPTDPGRSFAPKTKETAPEPPIIIPTGAAASSISSPSPTAARSGSRPAQTQPRRGRENTVPMESTSAQSAGAPATVDRRGVTQPMPQVPADRATRKEPLQSQAAAASASQPGATQTQKTGHTMGDVLRAFPSTIWTFAGGLVLLIIFAVVVIIGAWALLNGGDSGIGGVAVSQSPTPTLAAGPPNATPTLGPTPTHSPEPVTTPTPFSLTPFSSSALGFSLDYPEGWQQKEDDLSVIFSPSSDGLDPDNFKDIAMWIGIPADKKSAIADLLTEVLSGFPADAKTLNEGTISIASQTWTSAQIRFADENLGGEGIATLAVTNKDGTGYYLVAVAPAEKWNPTQPIFQEMINSFRFATGQEPAVAQAVTTTGTPQVASSTTPATTADTATKATTPTAESTRANTPIPTPKATATPLIYVVQPGDSLLAIANNFGVDVDLLAAKNDLDDPGKLSLGQELIIPFTAEELAAYNSGGSSGGGSSTTAETTEAAAEPSSSGATDTTTAAKPEAPPQEAAEPAEAPAPSSAPAPVSGRIIYPAFNPGTNIYDLWLADVTTGEQTLVADGASQPAFNKDGSLLAYRSWNLDTRGVWFRDFIAGRGGQVTRFVEDGLPTWSPDGISFAFSTRREGDRVPRIYRGNQEGKNDFSLNFQGEYPATLPDGRVVAKGCLPSGDCGVFIIGANGGGETKISTESGDTAPAPSPDGRKIAFMSSGRGGTNWEIWVMDVNGSNARRLTENGSNDGLPTWSPDGKSIAYVSDAGGAWAVWVMNADGSNQRKLFNLKGSPDGVVLHDKDNSKGWLEERISWAP